MYFNVNFDQQELMLSGHDDGQLMVWKMTAAKEQVFAIIWNDVDPPIQTTFTLLDLPIVFVIWSSWYTLVPRPWQVCLNKYSIKNDPLSPFEGNIWWLALRIKQFAFINPTTCLRLSLLFSIGDKILGNVHDNKSNGDDSDDGEYSWDYEDDAYKDRNMIR